MKKQLQILLDTLQLILRLPIEADSVKFRDFDERSVKHLSPWRSVTGELAVDRKCGK